jgi:protein-tyrosine phosphatase
VSDLDPTRIEIDTDPLEQRMRGITVHGDVYFDVPYMTEVVPGLWQGGCADGLVLPRGIRHVVSLYPWEEYTAEHRLDSSLTVRMYDSEEGVPDEGLLLELARWVNERRKTGSVLVHCQAGLNRSSLVVALALILDGLEPAEAVAHVRSVRSDACLCNRTFSAWLLGLDPGALTAA